MQEVLPGLSLPDGLAQHHARLVWRLLVNWAMRGWRHGETYFRFSRISVPYGAVGFFHAFPFEWSWSRPSSLAIPINKNKYDASTIKVVLLV